MLSVVRYIGIIILHKKSNQMVDKNDDRETERKIFASMAMQGLCVNLTQEGATPKMIAEQAVKFADALIYELEKSN